MGLKSQEEAPENSSRVIVLSGTLKSNRLGDLGHRMTTQNIHPLKYQLPRNAKDHKEYYELHVNK